MQWEGVFPAVTTPFHADGGLDFDAFDAHVERLVAAGSRGVVPLGSLGEAATLTHDEKIAVLSRLCERTRGRCPIVAGVSGMSTAEAVDLARDAERVGCRGLMVLPPYVYRGDWRETRAHLGAVIAATSLSCMLYNNPIAYGTDILPHQIKELAEAHDNLDAVKESSTDVRRLTAIREHVGDRLALFVGVDDVIVEGVAAGAVGWIAGLVNALPEESVRLFELARAGRTDEVRTLYEWFLPLLRLDTVPKFVQLIKLVAHEVDGYPEHVRPPRLPLDGAERRDALAIVRAQLAARPTWG